MERRVLGLIVADSDGSPLAPLGAPADTALLPFAGRYRLIDFALATLANSGISEVCVCAPKPSEGLREYLTRPHSGAVRPRFVLPLPRRTADRGRARRLLDALTTARPLVRRYAPDAVAVLFADTAVLVDLRQVLALHDERSADLVLPVLPVPPDEVVGRLVPELDGEGCIRDIRRAWEAPASARGFVPTWTGAATVRTDALAPLLAARTQPERRGVCEGLRLLPYDVLQHRLPGTATLGAYWHEPVSLEAYYAAQMAFCTARPPVDLYNPAWPVGAVGNGLPPAKVVTDTAGRAGQALDSLVSEGSLIQGGVVVKSIVGHRVVVEGGAEVDDCVLLDGCRIGRGARIRRAIVGPGVVVGDGEEIGYGATPPAPASLRQSGLTILPSTVRASAAPAT